MRVRIFTAAICRGTLRIAGEERLRGAEEELLQWYAGILLCPDIYTQPILVYCFSSSKGKRDTFYMSDKTSRYLHYICIILFYLFLQLFTFTFIIFLIYYFVNGYSFSICMQIDTISIVNMYILRKISELKETEGN